MIIRMGAMSFCWTSREDKDREGNDGVIFENYLPNQKF
jgi:hypothetical protein